MKKIKQTTMDEKQYMLFRMFADEEDFDIDVLVEAEDTEDHKHEWVSLENWKNDTVEVGNNGEKVEANIAYKGSLKEISAIRKVWEIDSDDNTKFIVFSPNN